MKTASTVSTPSPTRRPARSPVAAALGASLALLWPAIASADEGDGAAGEEMNAAQEVPEEDEEAAEIDYERRSPLSGQPAIRNRLLLASERLEITPTFEATINAPYRHTLSGGLKGEYHITSTWSVGVLGLFGESFNTGLTDRILDDLPASPGDEPEPSQDQFSERLTSMPLHGAGYIGFKPFYGKLSAFGSLFFNYNIYFDGGVSVAVLENDCCSFPTDNGDGDPRTDDPQNDGTELGFYAGAGVQVFVNDFMAIDLSIRDYYFRHNPSGATGDVRVAGEDERLRHHFAAGFGLAIFFPSTADRTP